MLLRRSFLAVCLLTVTLSFSLSTKSAASEMTLLFVTTPGCTPCQQVTPLMNELIQQGYPVQVIDAATMPEAVKQLQVDRFPTFVMIAQNTVVDRVIGGGDPVTIKPRIMEMFARGAGHLAKQGNLTQQGDLQQPNMITSRVPTSATVPTTVPVTVSETPKTFKTEFSPVFPANTVNAANDLNTVKSVVANTVNQQTAPLIFSSVKLRVDDARGHSWGTGTIIDTRNGAALVLTCGHVFRDSRGQGNIEVHLFDKNAEVKVPGRCVSYDLEMDLGLVAITPPFPIRAVPMAVANVALRTGQEVFSVGCDGGADPTMKTHIILSTDRVNQECWINESGTRQTITVPFHYVQVSEAPVSGRSGGGLFSQDGFLIGVCNAADPKANDGHFVPTSVIRYFLSQKNMAHIADSPSLVDSHAAPLASLSPISVQPNPPVAALATPSTATTGMREDERATLEEIKRHVQDGDEVIVIVRPRNLQTDSDVFVLNNASPSFIDALTIDRTPPPAESTRQPVSYTVFPSFPR